MRANRAKTTGIMGFVVSILLHGIFFAGCMALDYTNAGSPTDTTEINDMPDETLTEKSKS